MLALITRAHAGRTLGKGPSKMELITGYEFNLLEATTETFVVAENEVHHLCTQISYHSPCGICEHYTNIGLVTN